MMDTTDGTGVPASILNEVQARWGKLAIQGDKFALYAADLGADLRKMSSDIGADLYLAFACAQQLPGAVAAFDKEYAGKIRGIGRSLGRSDAFADEVLQRVCEKLFVAPPLAAPGIAQFRGDCPLSAWVNTVARRIAFRQAKSLHPERFVHDDVLANELANACDQELALVREQHREIVRAALVEALRNMPKREQRFLQMNLVAGVSMDRIGQLYGLSQSSISRKIQRAIGDVVAAAKKDVRTRLRISIDELESIFNLIQSCIDLTLTHFDDVAAAVDRSDSVQLDVTK